MLTCRGLIAALPSAGAFDTFLNVQITLVLALQMALCLACSLVSLWWRNSAGYARYYLALNVYNEGMLGPIDYEAAPVHEYWWDCCCPSYMSNILQEP